MAAAHITRLPTETIQLISSVCHTSDLVALSRTCRRLHGICNGKAPLRACIFRHLGLPTSDYVTSKDDFRKLMLDDAPVPEAWMVDKLALALARQEGGHSDGENENSEAASDRYWARIHSMITWEPWPTRRELWARLAAAAITLSSRVDRLGKLLRPDPDHQNPLIRRFEDWISPLTELLRILSVLVVFAYPTVIDARIAVVLTTLAEHAFDHNYWEAHIQIMPMEWWLPISLQFREIARMLVFCVAIGTLGNDTVDVSELTSRLSKFEDYTAKNLGPRDFDVLFAAPVAWVVRQKSKGHDELPRLPRLPFLRNILNGEVGATDMMMDLPHPGQEIRRKHDLRPSWQWWFEDNSKQMFTDHADGEWIGYYTYRSEDGSSWEYECMRGLRFIDHEQWPDAIDGGTEYWTMEAHGIDCSGPFHLEGEYSRDEEHAVELYKVNQGPDAQDWAMRGSLTPLGIVGRWWEGARENSPTRAGFVWMFKSQWVEEGEVIFAE